MLNCLCSRLCNVHSPLQVKNLNVSEITRDIARKPWKSKTKLLFNMKIRVLIYKGMVFLISSLWSNENFLSQGISDGTVYILHILDLTKIHLKKEVIDDIKSTSYFLDENFEIILSFTKSCHQILIETYEGQYEGGGVNRLLKNGGKYIIHIFICTGCSSRCILK